MYLQRDLTATARTLATRQRATVTGRQSTTRDDYARQEYVRSHVVAINDTAPRCARHTRHHSPLQPLNVNTARQPHAVRTEAQTRGNVQGRWYASPPWPRTRPCVGWPRRRNASSRHRDSAKNSTTTTFTIRRGRAQGESPPPRSATAAEARRTAPSGRQVRCLFVGAPPNGWTAMPYPTRGRVGSGERVACAYVFVCPAVPAAPIRSVTPVRVSCVGYGCVYVWDGTRRRESMWPLTPGA